MSDRLATTRRPATAVAAAAALALAGLLLVARPAAADAGELTVGASGTWAAVRGGRAGVFLECGALPYLAAYGAVEAGLAPGGAAGEGLASLGATLLYDVFAWVPTLTLSGGVIGGARWQGRAAAQVAVRKFVSRSVWLGLGGGAEWRPEAVRGLLSLTVGFGQAG